jgi:hypothetical protein
MQADLRMYLWFYEWTLFDAVTVGQHTRGYWVASKRISSNHKEGELSHPGIKLLAETGEEEVRLVLTITNEAEHNWPETAAIIACFNPGGVEEQDNVPPTSQFFDPERDRTWYYSSEKFDNLSNRDIHFNTKWRSAIDKIGEVGKYIFSDKWPSSQSDASAGILIRESMDGE